MTTYRIKINNLICQLNKSLDRKGILVVFCQGLPASFKENLLFQSLIDNGYDLLQPFYSGSYDSAGNFNPTNCVQDIEKLIEVLQSRKIFNELYFNKEIALPFNEIVLMGSSYGGSIAAITSAINVHKKVLLSPVLEYNQNNIEKMVDNFDFKSQMFSLLEMLKNAYPYTYRMNKNDRNELQEFLTSTRTGETIKQNIQKSKIPILVVHGKKDDSIPYELTRNVLESIENELIQRIYPGDLKHSMSSYGPDINKKISNFIFSD